jgi:hypothetical protein
VIYTAVSLLRAARRSRTSGRAEQVVPSA